MTTPEERAKEVVRSLCEPLDGNKPYLETPIRKTMAEVIAAAIRQAENSKLEEAAALVAREYDLQQFGEEPTAINRRLSNCVIAIRSLKSKD